MIEELSKHPLNQVARLLLEKHPEMEHLYWFPILGVAALGLTDDLEDGPHWELLALMEMRPATAMYLLRNLRPTDLPASTPERRREVTDLILSDVDSLRDPD